MSAHYVIGVDVGGTFTDCVLYNEVTTEKEIRKILSTPKDPSIGVFKGIDLLLETGDNSMNQVSRVIHGTTLVANAVIERKGAHVGMITTGGFVNVLDMRREWRYDNYDFHLKFPEPLVPKYLRKEVNERVLYDGKIHTPINSKEVVNAARELIEEASVESIAICFIHSYANSDHERAAKNIVKSEFPDIYVTTSSEIAPYVKEFDRFSTTVINAYTLPLIDRYLDKISNGLVERGFDGKVFLFFITSCSGGLVTSEIARSFPVLLLESGPAAGVRITGYIGRRLKYGNMLSFDMGGTTAKGCVIKDYLAEKSYEFEVSRIQRFKAGSGYPVMVPSINLMEMGAGGGSIVKVDARGVLQVGPESAGAEPGPACYSFGGSEATVTDADLVLGYLNPYYFLGGQILLDVEKAKKSIREATESLQIPVDEAAYGIFEIVNQNMAQAFRIHSVERGVDIRKFDVVAFGGAGPVHAWKVAENLYCQRVIVPFEAGIASAMGLLVTPLSFDYARTKRMSLNVLTPENFREVYHPVIEERLKLLEVAGITSEKIEVHKTLDMRYRGQGFNIEIEIPPDFNPQPQHLKDLFETEYTRLYTLKAKDVPIEIYNFKVLVTGPEFEIDLSHRPKVRLGSPVKGSRDAYFGEKQGYNECKVYDRYCLQPGTSFKGPAIVEETTSTCVIPPGAKATVDRFYNIIINLR